MSAGRIGDRELGRGASNQDRGLTRAARLSTVIASPFGVLTLLPLLVASIGIFLTWVGQSSLRESNLTMAGDRIDEETTLLARGIGSAFEQAGQAMGTPTYMAPEQALGHELDGRPSDARALAAALKTIHIASAEHWSEAQARAWWAARRPKPPSILAPSKAEVAQRGVT